MQADTSLANKSGHLDLLTTAALFFLDKDWILTYSNPWVTLCRGLVAPASLLAFLFSGARRYGLSPSFAILAKRSAFSSIPW